MANVAQLVERSFRKAGVASSTLAVGFYCRGQTCFGCEFIVRLLGVSVYVNLVDMFNLKCYHEVLGRNV